MSWLEALILGLVEGVTEFLPISSTGHLILTQNLLGMSASEGLNAYLIAVQVGAIAAVIVLYPQRFKQLFVGAGQVITGKVKTPQAHLLFALAVAFIPAAIVGLLLDDWIEQTLFSVPMVLAALLVGALLMVLLGRAPQKANADVEKLTLGGALKIGLWQILSLWPGMSRSMTTIVGGYRAGLSPAAAAEFSFVLGALILAAASLYKGIKSFDAIMALGIGPVAIGAVAAFISAVVVVKLFVGALTRYGLLPWAIYRVILAVVIGLWFCA